MARMNQKKIRQLDYKKYYRKTHFPVDGNFDIIRKTDHIRFHTVLDVGFGMGGASVYFAEKGKIVTAIGRELKRYNFPREIFEAHEIKTQDVWIEDFNTEQSFDAIWASHVLEHTANTSIVLQKFRSLLTDEGWLFLCVPPHKASIVSGHISMGWSVVQLMLVLYFNGFRVKTGHFGSHRYNIAAFVQKEPSPRHTPSEGGIVPLHEISDDFPIDLHAEMDGQLPAVNWFEETNHRPLVKPMDDLVLAVSTIKTLRNEIARLREETPAISTENYKQALLTSELNMADSLNSWLGDEKISPLQEQFVSQPRNRGDIGQDHYQLLHEHDNSYQQNNWLVEKLEDILAAKPKTVIELGCGNGKFVKHIAPHVDRVLGIDWAKSPLLEPLPNNADFSKSDFLRHELISADLICSADVLEHFEPNEIVPLLAKMKSSALLQYHVISCYDDGHSHLSIMSPGVWLAMFRKFDENFQLADVTIRRNDPKQIICTITNIGSE